jgi:hypothetical protein
MIKKPFDDTPFQKVLVYDFLAILGFYLGVKTALRIYNHNRSERA